MRLNFGMTQLFGHKRMPKTFGSKQDRINGTSFTKCHSGQNGRVNFWRITLGLGQESLGIFEQHMTQRNYENYLGIIGWK